MNERSLLMAAFTGLFAFFASVFVAWICQRRGIVINRILKGTLTGILVLVASVIMHYVWS